MSFKIVVDSCGELTPEMEKDPRIISAPLTLEVGGETFVDDNTFQQKVFLNKIAASPECPKSSCPSPKVYYDNFSTDAEHHYAVTLSAELSGSYNSAMLGRSMAMEDDPKKKVYVFNSRSASIGQTLIAKKIMEFEEAGMEFDKIVEAVEAYISSQNTYFVLENLDTLRKNGRLSNLKAFFASALKIKPICGATPEGQICQLDQARGINKALVKMVDYIAAKAVDSERRTLAITHCNCPERAQMVLEAIKQRIKVKDSFILDTAGVSTMYANDGGIIVVL